MKRKRWIMLIAIVSLLSGGVAHAQVPTHVNVITSASAHWILGPAGEGRIRYASAHYFESIQDTDRRVIAAVYIGTCRVQNGNHDRCRSRRYASHEDFEPLFVMDPAMQIATLDLGPHHVEWHSGGAPYVTLVGVVCDPETGEEDMGPHLGRETQAKADMFGRHLETGATEWDYGFVGRGAFPSSCTWQAPTP